jgi:hypothetical protein
VDCAAANAHAAHPDADCRRVAATVQYKKVSQVGMRSSAACCSLVLRSLCDGQRRMRPSDEVASEYLVVSHATAGRSLSGQQAAAANGKSTITIQVRNGRNGKPMTANSIEVDCLSGQDGCEGFREVFYADPTGSARLQIQAPSSATELFLNSSEDQYDFCAGYDLQDSRFDIKTIETTGLLGKNNCKGLFTKEMTDWAPQPGRLVVFTHRKPWWIRMFPYC